MRFYNVTPLRLLIIGLVYLWSGVLFGQTIIGRPMLPLNSSGPPTTGLFAWYKSDAQTLAQNTAPGIPFEDSHASYDMTTLDGGESQNPYFQTNLINSLPALNWLTNTPASGAASIHITAAYSPITINGITIAFVGSVRTNPDSTMSPFILNDSNINFCLRLNVDGKRMTGNGYVDGGNGSATLTNAAVDTWHVITMQWAASDGVASIKNNSDTVTGVAGSTGNRTINYSGFRGYTGFKTAEVVVYTNKISSGDLTQLRTYLANKYAITITP